MSAAGFGNKDSKGNTLRTHAEDIPYGWMSPTSGPSSNFQQEKRLNRAERRALARKKKRR